MELTIFENGIQNHNNKIHQVIREEGLYVMHEQGYSYTVGMRNIGSPDFILYGQNPDEAEEIFQILFQAVRHGLADLERSNVIENVFDPKPKLSAVVDSEKRQYFYAARTYYGDWKFSTLKITLDLPYETPTVFDQQTITSPYSVIRETDTLILIKDNDESGHASVINAAEYTIKSLAEVYDLSNRRVIYQDTMLRFDELSHVTGNFTGFRALTGSQQEFFTRLLRDDVQSKEV